jgi:HAD superfamily hydrolase (TIGR01509 family)
MIKNIVFDLGNVLLSFVPSEYLIKKNYPAKIKNTILRDIFQSTEWKMLDNGDITVPEAIESIAAKSSLKREEIDYVFNFRRDIMFPLDDNARLLPELRKQGYKLYYLSNFPLDVFEEIKNDFYFFRHFDGGIISAEVRISKPDIRFYEYLIGKYSLNPSESLFIDDIEENVRAAEKAGMKAMFTNGSLNIAEQLEKTLAGEMA